jgi:membrane associated rhomboid family serine protease
MTPNPPLRTAPKFPVSSLIALACLGISLRYWFFHDLTGFVPASGSVSDQPWTLVTSIFPHGSVLHLIFNLYWWWFFATRLEFVWGAPKLIGAVILLAIISSGAEYAFLRGGIGLSGVVYGFCTLLWVVQGRYPALVGTVSRQTLHVFAAWFVVCVVLTIAGLLPVGNFAHGAGALGGWLLGKAIVSRDRRPLWIAALAATLVFAIAGSTIARPWVSLYRWSRSNALSGYYAFKEGRYEDAVRHLEAAKLENPRNVGTMVNLGSAYRMAHRLPDALAAYKRAIELDPAQRAELSQYVAAIFDMQSAAAAKRSDVLAVKNLAEESLRWNPGGEYPKKMLEWAKAKSNSKNGRDIIHPPTSTLPTDGAPDAPTPAP